MTEQDTTVADSTGPSLDKRLRLASNRHRRGLMIRLLEEPEVGETELLATDGDVESTVVQLYHVHLPMLDRQGVVEWDRDSGVIRRGRHWDSVRDLVEFLESLTPTE